MGFQLFTILEKKALKNEDKRAFKMHRGLHLLMQEK
jgi:hypothetical protein